MTVVRRLLPSETANKMDRYTTNAVAKDASSIPFHVNQIHKISRRLKYTIHHLTGLCT